ncbi:MAG: hypothetical protein ACRD1V_01115 [Vicinamibacterales bacterium]
MNMKQPVSVTLDEDNILWLKGQAAAATRGNVSEVVDRLIARARSGGSADVAIRSVVGTIDLPSDAALAEADAYVKTLFDRSLGRPVLVRERPPASKRGRRG